MSKKYIHSVEIVLKTNVSIIKVSSESEDMYASIDLTVEKLIKQLKKVKDKIKIINLKNLKLRN